MKDEEVHGEIDLEEGRWDLNMIAADADEDQQETSEEVEEVTNIGAGAAPGVKQISLWVRNCPFQETRSLLGSLGSATQVSWTAVHWEQPF